MKTRDICTAGLLALVLVSPSTRAASATVTVTITNDTGSDVGAILLSDPGLESWSTDLIGASSDPSLVLLAGDARSITVVAGTYDALVRDLDGGYLQIISNLRLEDGAELHLAE